MVLAAMQWCRVLEITRLEAHEFVPDRYAEVHYEDFVRDPHRVLDELFEFCELGQDRRAHEFLDARIELRRDTNDRWRAGFSRQEIERLDAALGPTLGDFGYRPDGALSRDAAVLATPFATRA